MSSPVDVELLKGVKKAYTHAFCPDGLSSAMIVLAAYGHVGMSPEILFVNYDKPEHDNVERAPGQLWVDITPPYKKWEDWKGLSPVVLDHHETAKSAVEGLGGVYGGLDDSGASLAFRHIMRTLNPGREDLEKWARFAYLCMLRDTWKDAHEDWEDACSVANALMFYTQKALLISSADGRLDLDEIVRFGKILMKKTDGKAYRLAENATWAELKGLKIAFFNNTEKIFSETCHKLLEKGADVAIGYYASREDGHNQMVLSIRSKKGGFPSNKLAELMGGGGHQPAAGCRILDADDISLRVLQNMMSGHIESLMSTS